MRSVGALALARKLVTEHMPGTRVIVTLNKRKTSLGYAKQGVGYNEIS